MKRALYASLFAMGCTIALGAQADKPQDKMMAKDAAAKTVAVTGCLAETDGQFVLNNATMAGQTTPMSFALTGGTLKGHVGHKVELTGALTPVAKDTMKPGAMAKDMPKEMPKKETMDMKKDAMASGGSLAVKDLKMVSPSCP